MNRKISFANGEYYHIYNRGVDKRKIFLDVRDYERFLKSMKEFNREDATGGLYENYLRECRNRSLTSTNKVEFLQSSPLVEIICFCLNPNHYHFILKQLIEKGIEKFMHRLGTGYTKYFNKKNERSGSLFQGTFKSIHIDSNEYLLYLSAYINKNHFIHNLEDSPLKEEFWQYSSMNDFLGKGKNKFVYTNPILSQFKNFKDYAKFVNENASYLKNKKETEKYSLE